MLTWLATLAVVATTAGNVHLVAVGVETYEDKSITPLKFAVADARAVADVFRSAGLAPELVTVLTSDQTDTAARPTRDRLVAALQAVRDKAEEDDRLVFFFAGHGVERDGQQYLYTADTRPDLLAETALPMPLVAKALEGIKARQVLFIVDACRNDPRAARGDADAVMTEGMARGLRPRLAAGEQAGPQVAVLLSCEVGQRAWEDAASGHGLFTKALLAALTGKATDADGTVRLLPVADYVEEEVRRAAAAQQREQRPSFSNPGGEEMDLFRPADQPLVRLVFDRTPLATVIRKVGDAFGAQIVLGASVDPAMAVTGAVEGRRPAEALRPVFARNGLWACLEGAIVVVQQWPRYLPPLGPVPGLRYRVSPTDDMPQVLIPAGEFVMGSPDGQGTGNDYPQRKVYVSAFWMDLHEVTVGQYNRFCQATGRQMDTQYNKDDRHPVVRVSWDDASAYATWAGRELPTEAQWEKAARGGTTTVYQWGDTFDVAKANNNQKGSTAVGSYAPNGFGLFDMAGNVWEWCRDWYETGWYGRMPGRDPVNTKPSSGHVIRGGSWSGDPFYLRVAIRARTSPTGTDSAGFRCSEAP